MPNVSPIPASSIRTPPATHARARRDYLKGLKATAEAKRKLSAKQLGELIYQGEKARTEEPKPVRPKVTRIARGNLAVQEEAVADAISQEDFERGFARALRGDEPTVIQFPQGKHEPVSSEYGSKKEGREKSRPIVQTIKEPRK